MALNEKQAEAVSQPPGDKKIKAITYKVQADGLTFLEALAEENTNGCVELSQVLTDLSFEYESATLGDFFETLISKSGIATHFLGMNDKDKSESKLDNIESLLYTARQEKESITLGEFLEQVAVSTDVAKSDEHNGSVSLSTIHSAKGLEWEHVYIVGFSQGTFPASQSISSGDISEERRLAYVAITRAKRKLVLSYARTGADYSALSPSQFIFETEDKDVLVSNVADEEYV